jgi:2-polyprenyl-3-methyl-5-hydroxy-6-metoxy-1,4-benzoquinol methylase
MVKFLNLSENDLVVEVASNDGYLLQFFADSKIQVLGIEPAAGVANLAIAKNIPTTIEFFGVTTAKKLAKNPKPKLIIGNNVLAHVPDLHDFIEGFSILVADEGIITFEFPHLLNLLKNNQFDTIYHEHYSYLSVTALLPLMERYKLKIIDVEKLPTHGGSLRVFIAKNESNWAIDRSVQIMLKEEAQYDPRNKKVYESFQKNILNLKSDLVNELLRGKESKKRIAAYGAAAKGVTLLNYCGIKSDLIDYVVDLNPNKQGNFLPGCQIPIVGSDTLVTNPPDILLVLAWNLSNEIKSQLLNQLNGGMKMLRAIPNVEYF